MTREQTEQEICNHLNTASKYDRKRVEDDVEFNLAMKQGDVAAALERAYGLIYGAAKDKTHHKRVMKKRRKQEQLEKNLEEFLRYKIKIICLEITCLVYMS